MSERIAAELTDWLMEWHIGMPESAQTDTTRERAWDAATRSSIGARLTAALNQRAAEALEEAALESHIDSRTGVSYVTDHELRARAARLREGLG